MYRAVGTSKQNVHQQLHRLQCQRVERSNLKQVITQIREDHPQMGARHLFLKIRPPKMGRDRFYTWYRENGLTIAAEKNWRRTTDSSGVIRFPNLIKEKELTGVNQVWVSDITYFQIGDQFHYITLVMDQYSRKIKGYSASQSLHMATTTVPAIKMALNKLDSQARPIIHSDGGGQYYGHQFLNLTRNRLENSMGKTAYENPHAERLNRTIKNQYLRYYNPRNEMDLKQKLCKAVMMYNQDKPHDSLGGYSPNQFEKKLMSN